MKQYPDCIWNPGRKLASEGIFPILLACDFSETYSCDSPSHYSPWGVSMRMSFLSRMSFHEIRTTVLSDSSTKRGSSRIHSIMYFDHTIRSIVMLLQRLYSARAVNPVPFRLLTILSVFVRIRFPTLRKRIVTFTVFLDQKSQISSRDI